MFAGHRPLAGEEEDEPMRQGMNASRRRLLGLGLLDDGLYDPISVGEQGEVGGGVA